MYTDSNLTIFAILFIIACSVLVYFLFRDVEDDLNIHSVDEAIDEAVEYKNARAYARPDEKHDQYTANEQRNTSRERAGWEEVTTNEELENGVEPVEAEYKSKPEKTNDNDEDINPERKVADKNNTAHLEIQTEVYENMRFNGVSRAIESDSVAEKMFGAAAVATFGRYHVKDSHGSHYGHGHRNGHAAGHGI